jgi:hypothetical protein
VKRDRSEFGLNIGIRWFAFLFENQEVLSKHCDTTEYFST